MTVHYLVHSPPLSFQRRLRDRLHLQGNYCWADTTRCQTPCFRWIDNEGFGADRKGMNQRRSNRNHSVTARLLRSEKRKWKEGRGPSGGLSESSAEKLLYSVTGWRMVEQGGQDSTCALSHLIRPYAKIWWQWEPQLLWNRLLGSEKCFSSFSPLYGLSLKISITGRVLLIVGIWQGLFRGIKM